MSLKGQVTPGVRSSKRLKPDNNDVDSECMLLDIMNIKEIITVTNMNINILLEDNKLLRNEVNEIRKICESLKSELIKCNVSSFNSQPVRNTYADQLKPSGPVILIAPKNSNQNSDTTKEFVKKSIDPVTNKVSSIRKAAKGAIVVECEDKNASEKFKNDAVNSLGDSYQITVPKKRKPQFKLFGMSDKLSEDELIECLIKQNECFRQKEEIRVVKLSESHNKKYKDYQAIIETDPVNYEQIMKSGKVSVNWDRCKVVEHVNVVRCFKCLGYNHFSKDCTNNVACKICAGEHASKDCISECEKCVNCIWHVEHLKMKLETNHSAFSTSCPVYRRKVEQEKRKIELNK